MGGLESIAGGKGLGILGFRGRTCFRFEIPGPPRTDRAFGFLVRQSETEAIRTAFDSATLSARSTSAGVGYPGSINRTIYSLYF